MTKNMKPATVLTIATCILIGGAFGFAPDDAVPPVDGGAEGRLPSREEVLGMLDSMTGLSDEEKENLRQQLMSDGMEDQLPAGNGNGQTQQFLMLFAFLGLVALIFLFIGYKLYTSLTERERQKLEKKRLKESKRKNK